MKKLWANTVIQTDASRNVIHVGANFLGEIRDLINESDLGGQERVSRVFNKFRRPSAAILEASLSTQVTR